MKLFYTVLGLLILFSITSIILIAVTLSEVINRLNGRNTSDSFDNNRPLTFADQINIKDLMYHLERLQAIADLSNGTRAIGTRGFTDTIEYITQQLKLNTDFIVRHEYFTLPNVIIEGTPELQSRVNGIINQHTYLTDFAHIIFSSGTDFDDFVQLVVIPNLGCQDSDWASVSVTGFVALVKRGVCTFSEKSELAEKYRAKAFLMYNDGAASDRFEANRYIRGHMNMTIPGYFLSYRLGMLLVDAASNSSVNVGIKMKINAKNADDLANICADTLTGDKTKTIIIGAHSDGVLDGSGINDDGSGSIGNLVLALNLARLLKTTSPSYVPFQYRVRFCWWGAEEVGLIGSTYHVQQAMLSNATIDNGRIQDYLLYFNYDMIASPNSNFGILDSVAIPPGTPNEALLGTNSVTALFQQWFNDQNLPWSKSGIGGGSDFVPFLVQGIVSGGVNTGAGGIKSANERDKYATMLGTGNGGLANVPYDSCYHQQCDRINNVNPFAYEKVVKAAAYAIEYTGRLNDLEKWLYPQGRSKEFKPMKTNQFDNMRYHSDLSLI